MACLFLSGVLSLAFPYFAGSLLDLALPQFKAVPKLGWTSTLGGTVGTLLIILGVQAASSFYHVQTFQRVGQLALNQLRLDTYARIIALPMAFLTQRRVGELSSRISTDLGQIDDMITGSLPHMLRQLILMTGGMVMIMMTSLKLTGVMFASIPPMVLLAVWYGRKLRGLSRETQDRLAESNVVVEETLQNVSSVKAYTNEGFEVGRYRTALKALTNASLKAGRYRAGFVAFLIYGVFAALVVVLWYGAKLMQAGELSVGALTRFLLYTTFVAGALGQFAEMYAQLQRTLGATQRVREILHEKTELDAEKQSSIEARSRLRGEINLQTVRFSYPSRSDVEVLAGINLHLAAGEKVALVGPSGAGKSTVASLVMQLYQPTHGALLYDGRPAAEFDLSYLRGQMAVVPQEVMLFGGTIAENIRYGKPTATMEEIESAARRANAHEFIDRFPERYETLVGERGLKLSGGQKQRVAIARAILRDPAILILDEATSALDSESEQLVQQALEQLMKNRTTLIIAHRLATIRSADRIVVLKDAK